MDQAVVTVVPYFYKAIDTFAELVAPFVNEHQLNDACLWLKENDKTVILSTFGALTFASLYISLSSKGGKKDHKSIKKEKKSYKVKVKKEKVIPVDPVKFAYDTITNVKAELVSTYISQVDKLEADVAVEQETKKAVEEVAVAKSKKSKSKKSKSKSKSKTEDETPAETDEAARTPYKDSTKYRYLYLNECLLKLLMRLDSVEPNGIEDIRMQRKAAIKEVQLQCKRLDAIKPLM